MIEELLSGTVFFFGKFSCSDARAMFLRNSRGLTIDSSSTGLLLSSQERNIPGKFLWHQHLTFCLAVTFMAQQINSLKQERNVVFIAVSYPSAVKSWKRIIPQDYESKMKSNKWMMKERWDHWVETAAGLGIEISPGNECQAVAKKSFMIQQSFLMLFCLW